MEGSIMPYRIGEDGSNWEDSENFDTVTCGECGEEFLVPNTLVAEQFDCPSCHAKLDTDKSE